MKKNWISAKLLGLAASVLGFSGTAFLTSCGENLRDEYGCPSIDYMVKGTVKSEAGTPIEGVKMVVTSDGVNAMDSLYTDKDGKFQTRQYSAFGLEEAKENYLRFEDVDGAANGEFVSKKVSLKSFETQQVEDADKKWFDGGFEFSGEVTLTEKEK